MNYTKDIIITLAIQSPVSSRCKVFKVELDQRCFEQMLFEQENEFAIGNKVERLSGIENGSIHKNN